MTKLFGVPIDQLVAVMVGIFLLGLVILTIMALRNRVAFRLAVRNIPRRRAQTALIVLGLMLATLLFSAAFATGDTLTHSIRHLAVGEIGETDVVVRSEETDENGRHTYFTAAFAERVSQALAESPDAEVIIGAVRERLPAYSAASGLSEPQVTVLGLPEGPSVGRLETESGAALDVADLEAGQAYLSAEAAAALEVQVGQEIQVFAGQQPTTFSIRDIYDRGDHPAGPVSLVLPLPVAQELIGVDAQINEVLVSNRGDALTGVEGSAEVAALVKPVVGGTGLEVTELKQTVLDDADAAGASFSTIFLLFAQFSVAAGVLLIFLIFVMLAAERKHELGIARAVGAQRGHVIRLFTFEGALYSVMAAAIGSILGVAVGYGMVFILKAAFAQLAEGEGALELAFAFNWKSVVLAFTLGMVLTFVVVVISSWRVSRLNIVRAVRDIPEPTDHRRTWRGLALAVLLPILGVMLAVAGLQGKQLGLFMLGTSLVIIGLPLLARRFGLSDRIAFTMAGAGLLVWWLMPASVVDQRLPEMEQGLEMFFISGIMLVIGGVWVVVYNSDLLLALIVALFGRIPGAPPVLKTAVSYPMKSRFRTGMTLAMFSLVVFTLVVMSFITAGIGQVFSDVEGISGGYDVRATANFLNPIADIRAELSTPPPASTDESGDPVALDDFTAIGSLGLAMVEGRPTGSTDEPEEFALAGADDAYMESTGYSFALKAGSYDSDEAVWAALRDEPDTVVVGASTVPSRADFSAGAPEPPFKFEGFFLQDDALPDISLSVVEPATGTTRDLRVIGVLSATNVYLQTAVTSRRTLDDLVGSPVPDQSFWFQLAEGRDPETVAPALERRFLANGLQAVSIPKEIEEFTATNVMINYLLQGFMGLGLVVGVAALGVIAARSVVERRQEIGVLRAIGFQRRMVRNSFLLESSFIALLGIGIGLALGFALSPQIINTMAEDFDGLTLVVPWATILIVTGVAYAAALLTTIIPAREASAVTPAEALRYE